MFKLDLDENIEMLQGLVNDGNRRLTHKIRKSHYYGGIATVDVVGCYLDCAFCWVPDFKRSIESIKDRIDEFDFLSPQDTFDILQGIGNENDFESVRLSGGEPTINKEHLLGTIELVSDSKYDYILETNGLMLDKKFVSELSEFRDDIYVYFSLKGGDSENFEELTYKDEEYWEKQLATLENIVDKGFIVGINIMANFLSKRELLFLIEKMRCIDPRVPFAVDLKKTSIFPHVQKRLKERGIDYEKPEVNSDKYEKILKNRYPDLYDKESENIIDKGGMTFFDFR